jgi:hypothetical protein
MWSMLCIILVVALEYIEISETLVRSTPLKRDVTKILFIAFLHAYSIKHLFQSLIINGCMVPEILRNFSEIDQVFSSKVYRTLIYKDTRLCLTLQFATMILFVIIMRILFLYFLQGYLRFPHNFAAFTILVPIFVNCSAILHFVNLVLQLRNKYKYLNSVLESSALTLY